MRTPPLQPPTKFAFPAPNSRQSRPDHRAREHSADKDAANRLLRRREFCEVHRKDCRSHQSARASCLPYFQVVFIRKLWEWRMGLGLIPERHRRDIILEGQVAAARAPTEGLDRDLEILIKPDRVHDVPAVQPKALLRLIVTIGADHLGQSGIGSGELLIVSGITRTRVKIV